MIIFLDSVTAIDLYVELENAVLSGRSLYMFGPKNKLRKICFAITNSQSFEYFIILMILVSSILLALDDPLKNNPN